MPADRYLTANDLDFHLRDWGGADQPIVLVHGLASNARIWDRVAPLLVDQFRVVALDQRSHGLSAEAPDGDYGFEAVCADLRVVCAQLEFGQPVIVGHSWGGGVALEFAGRYPQQVAGVIMVDGGFIGLNKRMTWAEAEQRLAPPRLAGTPLAEFRARAQNFLGELYHPDIFEMILGNFEVRADDTIAPHLKFDNHLRIVRAMWEQDAEAVYSQVRCPALFLPCVPPEPHDPLAAQFLGWKRESAAVIQHRLPRAQIDWLADSIHDVPLQRPELVAEKIRAFTRGLKTPSPP